MKKCIIMILAVLSMVSCKTLTGSAVSIDKSHTADEIIYDLAETYNIPEIGTVYDYSHKATVVSGTERVVYKVKVNKTWYEANRSIFNKYRIGDNMKKKDFNRIKN